MSRKDKKKQRKLREIIADQMDIPKEITQDLSKLVIIGEKELNIENYKGIIEYDNHVVRVKTPGRNMRVEGHDLEIKTVTDDDIQVSGIIDKIEFVK